VNKQKRYLITTADERTWKFDRPVIFLGEWCRLYKRKHIWGPMDAIVAKPYGLGVANKDRDYADAKLLEKKFFLLLVDLLNQHHHVNYSIRFWQVLLGHWFRRYVDVIINRLRTLESCIHEYEISGTSVYSNDQYTLATQYSSSATLIFNNDYWNNILNGYILNCYNKLNFSIEVIDDASLLNFQTNQLFIPQSLKRKVIKWCHRKISKCLNFLVKDTDAFIIGSFLPIREEIKLHLTLMQFPQLRTSFRPDQIIKPNLTLREKLGNQLIYNNDNNLERILGKMLFKLIPVCYLEGFFNLNTLVKQQYWPKNPKFIFTSNNFDDDDVFKLWTAIQIESGVKYFVGQHGNNYGTHRYLCSTIEEITADKFLTWGWKDNLSQHTPAFILKKPNIGLHRTNPRSGLLLIENVLPHSFSTWDVTIEFKKYFEEQQIFINALTHKPKKEITVRLHHTYKYFNWNELERWYDFDPNIKIEEGDVPISKLILQNRLVVHSYDSTGILECLAENIPTLAFWQGGLDHLRESAKPYYQLLVDAGVVHLNPKSAAHKVNEIWNDVDGWWRQNKVQKARKQFCKKYAKFSETPIYDLKKILLE